MSVRRSARTSVIAVVGLAVTAWAVPADSLAQSLVSAFCGTYVGTFSGDDMGSFTAVVDENGNVSGSGNSVSVGSFTITGSVSSAGNIFFVAGSVTTGATFTGVVTTQGAVSGTWENSAFGESGTFSGSRQDGCFFTLTVSKAGSGEGTVTSVPAGVNCGADCRESYASGTSVTLTAVAAAGSQFAGWSGCSSTSGATCVRQMNADRVVTATFSKDPSFIMSPILDLLLRD